MLKTMSRNLQSQASSNKNKLILAVQMRNVRNVKNQKVKRLMLKVGNKRSKIKSPTVLRNRKSFTKLMQSRSRTDLTPDGIWTSLLLKSLSREQLYLRRKNLFANYQCLKLTLTM